MKEKKKISFVIPCYRSEKTIEMVVNEIIDVMNERPCFDYEIIAVNDCSPDNVYEILLKLSSKNSKIKIVNLVKNSGKHAAILAGYSFVDGNYVVNLDDDFQSPINNLWKLIDPIESEEYDVATAKYIQKKEALWKRIGSSINAYVSEIMLDKPKGIRYENFSVLKRFVVDEVLKYKNPFPFLEGLVLRVTNKIISVPMYQRERGDDNKSGFTFLRSLSLFANGLTNFSVKPLRIALVFGFLTSLFGFIYGFIIVLNRILYSVALTGWSSIMAVLLFSSGVVMILLGIIGEYVGRIFICINNAPQFTIRNTVGFNDKELRQ